LVLARDDIDAHLVSGLLTNAGIESMHVHDVRAQVWLYGGADPHSPVRVMVKRLYLEDARIVLAEQALEAPAYEARTSPGSDPVSDPVLRSPASRTALWWATAITLGAILGGLILMQFVRPTIPCQLPILCGASAGD
jgi:hypothetical protein